MYNSKSLALAISLMMALLSGPGLAESLSVTDIIHRANKVSYYAGQDGRATVEMTITDDRGRSRQRRMVILRRDQPETDSLENFAYRGEQKFYVYFSRPADVNKMAFMVWKKLDADDDRWLYLPALDLVKRIAASDKRTSFVGSDFFYEDVSGRDIDEDEHQLLDTTDLYYVIKSTPKDPASVEFDHYKMYIHRASFIPVQVEYFDSGGKTIRIAKALKVETIQGYPTVTQASMENLQTGSKTLMNYSEVKYDLDTPDDIFSERYLRKPPRNLLR